MRDDTNLVELFTTQKCLEFQIQSQWFENVTKIWLDVCFNCLDWSFNW